LHIMAICKRASPMILGLRPASMPPHKTEQRG
jgi:hypothetical protein